MHSRTISPLLVSRRRGLLATVASLIITATLGLGSASAQDASLDATGSALVDQFITVLQLPAADKQAALADLLADEFQIVRSNGAVLDKEGYLASPATVIEVEISAVSATRSNGVLVVSYVLSVDEVIDGVASRSMAPRLSVFHERADGEWELAAHANFAALDPS